MGGTAQVSADVDWQPGTDSWVHFDDIPIEHFWLENDGVFAKYRIVVEIRARGTLWFRDEEGDTYELWVADDTMHGGKHHVDYNSGQAAIKKVWWQPDGDSDGE